MWSIREVLNKSESPQVHMASKFAIGNVFKVFHDLG